MTTFPSDPGEQERGTRRKPRRAAPLPAREQDDLFRDTQPPKGPSEGEERKEKAIEKHEQSGRAPLIRMLRQQLKMLYGARVRQRRDRLFSKDPVSTIDGQPFVTADDAVRILKNTGIVPHDEDGKEQPRNWMGAIFKEPGWQYTGHTVPSLRPELNGRHVRCWRWEGA
jgi:hypothetical protein